jgi:small neutral amino acid transporter SnatA (MarC family)
MSIRRVICTLLAIAFTNLVFASQEGAEVFQTFSISTAAVSVKGESSDNLINLLIVTAFGNTHQLSKGQLAKLDGLLINGIQISGEAGYPSLGG